MKQGVKRRRSAESGDDMNRCGKETDSAAQISIWVMVSEDYSNPSPRQFMVPADAVIDDLKAIVKAEFEVYRGLSVFDLVVSCTAACPEDDPVSMYVPSNSASNPLVLSLWKKDSAATPIMPDLSSSKGDLSDVGAPQGSTVYMELKEGSSDKFYELKPEGRTVTVRYGRCGASGMISIKSFETKAAAATFVYKTACEKRRKGYTDVGVLRANADADQMASGDGLPLSDPLADLEAGRKVLVQGSGKLPYVLKKFNGGYSCSCQGFIMNIKRKGIQTNTCKHLKSIRGEEAEALRCTSAGRGDEATVGKASAVLMSKNNAIPRKISLAHTWKIGMDPKNYIMSEKLDGMRAYWSAGKLWTRTGNEISAPEWFVEGLPVDTELDGELFLGRQQFGECMSIARRSDASEEWKRLTYVIFDAPKIPGGIIARLSAIEAVISTPYARVHPQEVCRDVEHLLEELAKVEQLGGEGMMIRNPTAAHRGGRTNDLLKVKSFHDAEAIVIGYEDGKGKYVNMVGSLICRLKDGNTFKVGSGLSDNERLYEKTPKIGSVITFKYFELTKDGIPRFPTFLHFRPDLSPLDFNFSTSSS